MGNIQPELSIQYSLHTKDLKNINENAYTVLHRV